MTGARVFEVELDEKVSAVTAFKVDARQTHGSNVRKVHRAAGRGRAQKRVNLVDARELRRRSRQCSTDRFAQSIAHDLSKRANDPATEQELTETHKSPIARHARHTLSKVSENSAERLRASFETTVMQNLATV